MLNAQARSTTPHWRRLSWPGSPPTPCGAITRTIRASAGAEEEQASHTSRSVQSADTDSSSPPPRCQVRQAGDPRTWPQSTGAGGRLHIIHDDVHSSADAPSPAHSRVRSVLGRLLASGSAAYQLMSSASNFPSRASHGCFSEKRFAETLSLRRLLSDASTFPQELDKELCGSPPALTRCVQGRAGLSPGLMNRSAMSGSDIPAILNAD